MVGHPGLYTGQDCWETPGTALACSQGASCLPDTLPPTTRRSL